MRINNRWLSVVFKLVLVASSFFGVLMQMNVFSEGSVMFEQLVYFTILSNLLAAGYFLVDAIAVARTGENVAPGLKGAVTMCLIVTGLVFNLILANSSFSMEAGNAGDSFAVVLNSTPISAVSNAMVHKISPLMVVLDWILFNPKGRFTKKSPFMWVLIPDVYFVIVTIRGFFLPLDTPRGRFPYFFINWDMLGWKVVPIVIGLNAAFIALGFAMVWLDNKMAQVGKRA